MQKRLTRSLAIAVLLTFGLAGVASATSVLYSDSGGQAGYGIGYSQWTSFTNELITVTGGNLSQTSNLNNYTQMMQYDAVFVDQRWINGSLSATEIQNITNYIATDRKVIMIGENNNWTAWNQQILGIVGGTFGGQYGGTAVPVISNSITDGVSSINVPTGGIVASGGTALFNHNFATLWGDNVLTVLDVNVFTGANQIFEINVAEWIADSNSGPAPVPEPGTIVLFGVGIGGLAFWRRKQSK